MFMKTTQLIGLFAICASLLTVGVITGARDWDMATQLSKTFDYANSKKGVLPVSDEMLNAIDQANQIKQARGILVLYLAGVDGDQLDRIYKVFHGGKAFSLYGEGRMLLDANNPLAAPTFDLAQWHLSQAGEDETRYVKGQYSSQHFAALVLATNFYFAKAQDALKKKQDPNLFLQQAKLFGRSEDIRRKAGIDPKMWDALINIPKKPVFQRIPRPIEPHT
jgi:hypothetical protein